MTKQIGLAKPAYQGAPRAPRSSVPFGQDNHELRAKESKWNYKSKLAPRSGAEH
jgi:hypothetical protein